MSQGTVALATDALPAVRQLGQQVLAWIRKNLPSVLLTSGLGFIGGWLLNTALMVFRYQGFATPGGSPVTGQGSMINGTLFWFLGSTIVFSLFGYRRAVGKERFWRDVKSIPDIVKSIWRADGSQARIHLLWGFALACILQQVISPSLAGVIGVGVALTIPTFLSRVLMGFAYRVWGSVTRAVAPTKAVAVPGVTAMTVGMLGTVAAFLAGFVVNGTLFRIPGFGIRVDTRVFLGLAAGGLAWWLMTQATPPSAVAVILGALVLIEAWEVLSASGALADDGGWDECVAGVQGFFTQLGEWFQCPVGGTGEVIGRGTVGGVATAAGSAVGTGLGAVLGQAGGGPGGGPDGNGHRPPEPGGEHGWTWGEDGESINLPEWAPPGTVMPLPPGYPGPIVFDDWGQPLETNENGQVNWGGEWMDPKDAADDISHWADRRQAERDAFWEEDDRLRDQIRQRNEQRARDADAARRAREEAEATLNRIREIAGRHDWDDLTDRTYGEQTYDEDGNIDPNYVNRLRDVIRNRIGRDIQAPDPDPNAPSWIEEGATETWNDARNSFVIRLGTGVLTGGASEVVWQGADVIDRVRTNAEQAVDEGRDYGFGDALRDTAAEFTEQNLPVNTIRTMLESRDPPPSATEIAMALGMDVLNVLDVIDSTSRVRNNGLDFGVEDALNRGRQALDDMGIGGKVPDGPKGPRTRPDVDDFTRADNGANVPRDRLDDFGVPEQNLRHANQVADKHLVEIKIRPSNPETVKWLEQGAHPKPPDLKSKTINEVDTYLMPGGRSANAGKRGTVGYFEPELPGNINDLPADLQSEIRARFRQRADEFADQAPKYDKLVGEGKIKIENGQIIHHDGNPFTGDHDLWAITDLDGNPVPPAIKEQVVRDLAGPPFNAQHGAHTDWTPTNSVDQGIDARIRDSHGPGGEGLLTTRPGYGDATVTYHDPTPGNIQADINQTLNDIRVGGERPTGVMSGISSPPPQAGVLSDSARSTLVGARAGINAGDPAAKWSIGDHVSPGMGGPGGVTGAGIGTGSAGALGVGATGSGGLDKLTGAVGAKPTFPGRTPSPGLGGPGGVKGDFSSAPPPGGGKT